jgi:predicted dehydrogenase
MKPERIRLCLIGAGRAGQVHARSLTERVRGGDLVAVVDENRETLDKTAALYGVEDRFTSLEEALDAADFDAAIITTDCRRRGRAT